MAKFVLDDRALRALEKKINKAGRSGVKVGVLSAKGGEAKAEGSPITMIELAAIHEFGAPKAGIPARSFVRSAFANNPSYRKFTSALAGKIVDGSLTVDQAYALLGEWGVREVRNNVTSKDIPPPLKQSTIDAKNRRAGKKADTPSKPLVDTGRLLQAIQWEID